MNIDNMKKRCDWLLTALVGSNLVESWWVSPNKNWDMKTPKEVFATDPESVYNYLMGHAFG